jgi:hypothetical protein
MGYISVNTNVSGKHMTAYTPPTFKVTSFNCPTCGAFARQYWFDLGYISGSFHRLEDLDIAICEHCSTPSYWHDEKMIVPDIGGVALPNTDLPKNIKDDYNEARSILSRSPRGAAALLRLAIQKLCKYLGENGKNINDDIGNLVKKGLPVKVQQSLDILRVVGNNAVHPGQIDLKDNHDLAISLFGLINIIADVMITQPKHVDNLYSGLPPNLIKGIENRDKK